MVQHEPLALKRLPIAGPTWLPTAAMLSRTMLPAITGTSQCSIGFQPEVIWLGEFPFPTGSPAANNLRGHCCAIRDAGFTVGLLPNQCTGRAEDAQPDGTYCFREFPYWPLCRPGPESRFKNFLHCLTGKHDARFDWFLSGSAARLKAVIVYTGYWATVPFLLRLRRLCRRHRIRLISYVVEWQSRHHYRNALSAIDGDIQRRWINPRLDGIICISRYLQDCYERRGVRTALIPPLLDLSDPMWPCSPAAHQKATHRPIRLLFSGYYRRDRQDILIRSVKRIREQGAPVVLEYLGASRENIAALPNVGRELLDSLGDGLHFHGRVPDDQVYRIAASASFAVLLREDERWSRACFPSKLPEFSALGVPMLCNITSDLAGYLRDGLNAIIVREVTVDAMCAALDKALALNEHAYHAMRTSARTLADRFDGSHYAAEYRRLIGELVHTRH
jgi:glycosyltransferase involved in cell wall biosynthesis